MPRHLAVNSNLRESFRPNTAAAKTWKRINTRLRRSRGHVFSVLLALAPLAPVVSVRLEGRLGEILALRSLGGPVQLADGAFEQRYTVVANVGFTITSASGNSDDIGDIRVIEEGVETLASAYVGAPGFHGEIRVRSSAPEPPVVTVRARR